MTPMDMARTLATRKWIAAVEVGDRDFANFVVNVAQDGGERPKESEINLALPMSPEEVLTYAAPLICSLNIVRISGPAQARARGV